MANFKGIPTPIIRTQGIDPKAKTGALRGDVCLQLKDALTGKVTDEFRGHNMLTNGLESAMNGCPFDINKIDGSYTQRSSAYSYSPIYEQLLGGLMLFPQALGNDANLLFPSFSNAPTGFASMDNYQQGDSRQGSYDAVSSGVITNGFRHVFSWGSAFGNGTIASLGLAPKYCEGWCSDVTKMLKPNAIYATGGFNSNFDNTAVSHIVAMSPVGTAIICMNPNGRAYTRLAFYSNQRPHDIRLLQKHDVYRFEPDPQDNSLKVAFSNEHRDGYTWAVDIPEINWNSMWNKCSIQIIGSYIYIIYHSANGATFTVKRLSVSDGSEIDTNTYTFSASFGNCKPAYHNGYIYCGSSTAGKIYKCNCSNVADVIEITSAKIIANANLISTGAQWIYNEYFILDADADVIVAFTGQLSGLSEGMLYSYSSWGSDRPLYDDGMWLLSTATGRQSWVSANLKQWGLMTHFDLQNAVVKTPDKQMEVQYSITQV